MDILTVNKEWINASHYHARLFQRTPQPDKNERRYLYEYLDVMGLFETGWMTYDFNTYKRDRIKFGYPNNE